MPNLKQKISTYWVDILVLKALQKIRDKVIFCFVILSLY